MTMIPQEDPNPRARAVISTLRQAGCRPEFGFDQEQAEELWETKLAAFTLPMCAAAANAWIEAGDREFPTLGELMTLAQGFAIAEREEVQRRERMNRDPLAMVVCPECFDEPVGWVEVIELAGARALRPCSRCLPDRYRAWRGGHFALGHDEARCRDTWCVETVRRRKHGRKAS